MVILQVVSKFLVFDPDVFRHFEKLKSIKIYDQSKKLAKPTDAAPFFKPYLSQEPVIIQFKPHILAAITKRHPYTLYIPGSAVCLQIRSKT
jgi:hypothetical protein